MLLLGEKRHRIGNTEGYVYIWNCSLIVQKAYSGSTQRTRLKIQINTQITKNLITKSLTPKIIKNHSIPLFDKLPYLSHFQTNKKNNPRTIPTQNPKSISTLHFQTNHRTLYTNFTISNNKLLYLHKHLSNLITEPNTSISKIMPQYFICTQT